MPDPDPVLAPYAPYGAQAPGPIAAANMPAGTPAFQATTPQGLLTQWQGSNSPVGQGGAGVGGAFVGNGAQVPNATSDPAAMAQSAAIRQQYANQAGPGPGTTTTSAPVGQAAQASGSSPNAWQRVMAGLGGFSRAWNPQQAAAMGVPAPGQPWSPTQLSPQQMQQVYQHMQTNGLLPAGQTPTTTSAPGPGAGTTTSAPATSGAPGRTPGLDGPGGPQYMAPAPISAPQTMAPMPRPGSTT